MFAYTLSHPKNDCDVNERRAKGYIDEMQDASFMCASISGFLFERVRKQTCYARDNKHLPLGYAVDSVRNKRLSGCPDNQKSHRTTTFKLMVVCWTTTTKTNFILYFFKTFLTSFLGCSVPLDNARTIPGWLKHNLKTFTKSFNKNTILYQNRSELSFVFNK